MGTLEIETAEQGMKFFGRMSASATHEIKNTLAIINESAGLLEDLSQMPGNRKSGNQTADRENSLPAHRVLDISQRVTRQVKRADLVLRKLNKFSHSIDHGTKITDLGETVGFVLDLGSRLIEMQGTRVELVPPVLPIRVETHVFYLENMIWKAVEAACDAADGNKQVTISFGNDPHLPLILFSMQAVKKPSMDALFTSKQDKYLMEYLNISIKKNKENNGFGLVWPKSI